MYSTTLIFDVDGTLVDISNSYNLSILHTSYIYCARILGFTDLPVIENWFSETHINDLKNLYGFNSDFVCTVALIDFLLDLVNIESNEINQDIPFTSIKFSKRLKQEISSYKTEWQQYLGKKYMSQTKLPELILKSTKNKPLLLFEGSIKENNYLERIFQEFYFGKEDFENYYSIPVQFVSGNEGGFYKSEKLTIPVSLLTQLQQSYNLAIFSGRPRKDLELFLDFFNLKTYFKMEHIISLDDCLEAESQWEGEESFSKPHPWGIIQIIKKFSSSNRFIMIGDSTDDIMASIQAQIQSIFVNFNPNREVRQYTNLLGIIEDWADLIPLLNKFRN